MTDELLAKILRELERIAADVEEVRRDGERILELNRKQTRLLDKIERNTS